MKLFLYSLFSISLLSLSSCKKECDFWMEGDDCGREVRLNYYGSYIGSLDESTGLAALFTENPDSVQVSLTEYSGDAKRIYLNHPYYGQIFIVLAGTNEFEVPFQTFDAQGGWFNIQSVDIRGSGTITSGQLSYSLNLTFHTESDVSEHENYNGLKSP